MLRFLANENFPGDAVRALTRTGYDVAWILKDAPGSSDDEVLKKAMEEERTLITFDKDFGELAFKRGLPASCGIILFRIPLLSPQYVVKIVEEALKSRDDWAGYFSVVEMSRIRMKPIFRVE
jgi:predicted nuclease of predicted toxin-antitoxin system